MFKLFPDWRVAQMRDINRANLGDDSNIGMDIAIVRRGVAEPLEAQAVRIVVRQESQSVDTGTAQGQKADVLIVGDTDLDIQAGDEFYDAENNRYKVVFVRPNRTFNTVAEAIVR